MLFPALQRLHLADGLLLGHVPDGTGVEQDDIGVVLLFDEAVAPAGEVHGDLFGVADVHLAAVGFDEDRGHKGSA